MGIAGVFSMVGNWQYAQVIPVQTTERRALAMLAVSTWASIASMMISIVAVIIVVVATGDNSQLSAISGWLWAIPFTTFGAGISGALSALANWRRDYRFMAGVTVSTTIVASCFSMLLGYLGAGVSGLVFSYIIGSLITFVFYAFRYPSTFKNFSGLGFSRVLVLARRHSSFPIYSLPANVLRTLALTIPNWALVYVGETDIAGQLSRAQSLLALPIGLIGIAVAQVFQQKAVQERALRGDCWLLYKRLLTILAFGSPILFGVLALAAPQLFVLYLGDHWKGTGDIARILAPMMCLRMIAGPLWPVFAIFNENKFDFGYAVWQFAATSTLTVIVIALAMSSVWQIVGYAFVNAMVSIANIARTFWIVRSEHQLRKHVD